MTTLVSFSFTFSFQYIAEDMRAHAFKTFTFYKTQFWRDAGEFDYLCDEMLFAAPYVCYPDDDVISTKIHLPNCTVDNP